jgi:hypothetical protein
MRLLFQLFDHDLSHPGGDLNFSAEPETQAAAAQVGELCALDRR